MTLYMTYIQMLIMDFWWERHCFQVFSPPGNVLLLSKWEQDFFFVFCFSLFEFKISKQKFHLVSFVCVELTESLNLDSLIKLRCFQSFILQIFFSTPIFFLLHSVKLMIQCQSSLDLFTYYFFSLFLGLYHSYWPTITDCFLCHFHSII